MTPIEELKHAHARIAADGKSIAELQELHRDVVARLEERINELLSERNPSAEEYDDAIESARRFCAKFRAMHRRAQRAESELAKERREHSWLKRWRGAAEKLLEQREAQVESLISNRDAHIKKLREFRAVADSPLGIPDEDDAEIRWSVVEPEPTPPGLAETLAPIMMEKTRAVGPTGSNLLTLPEQSFSEGDTCPACKEGELSLEEGKDCLCHLSPPCAYCMDRVFECPDCGWREGDKVADAPATHPVRPNASACGQCADKVEIPGDWKTFHGRTEPLE